MGAETTDEPASLAREYRYGRFTTRLLLRDMRFRREVAGSGDVLPGY